MSNDLTVVEKTVSQALSGKGAHVEVLSAFEGLDWSIAVERPVGVQYSILQLLNHMSYWQDWVVQWLDGDEPEVPEHASGGWPGSTTLAGPQDWQQAVAHFKKGLGELMDRSRGAALLVARGDKSPLEILESIALHNSYHVGQVVLLRRMLDAWPPPSGGVTW